MLYRRANDHHQTHQEQDPCTHWCTGVIAKSNGISLKDHLHKNATTTNNVATSYPSDLTALTDRIISYVDSSSKKSNHPSTREHRQQDGDKDKDKDACDQSKDSQQEGTQFAQTEGESP